MGLSAGMRTPGLVVIRLNSLGLSGSSKVGMGGMGGSVGWLPVGWVLSVGAAI